MKCRKCLKEMKPLFTSWYCDCTDSKNKSDIAKISKDSANVLGHGKPSDDMFDNAAPQFKSVSFSKDECCTEFTYAKSTFRGATDYTDMIINKLLHKCNITRSMLQTITFNFHCDEKYLTFTYRKGDN